MKNCKKNKGFSLVELIVVVAIMAVLVGVLAPAYLRYVDKTRLQKDISAVGEVIKAIEVAAADEAVLAEIGDVNDEGEPDSLSTYIKLSCADGATASSITGKSQLFNDATNLTAKVKEIVGGSIAFAREEVLRADLIILVAKDADYKIITWVDTSVFATGSDVRTAFDEAFKNTAGNTTVANQVSEWEIRFKEYQAKEQAYTETYGTAVSDYEAAVARKEVLTKSINNAAEIEDLAKKVDLNDLQSAYTAAEKTYESLDKPAWAYGAYKKALDALNAGKKKVQDWQDIEDDVDGWKQELADINESLPDLEAKANEAQPIRDELDAERNALYTDGVKIAGTVGGDVMNSYLGQLQ